MSTPLILHCGIRPWPLFTQKPLARAAAGEAAPRFNWRCGEQQGPIELVLTARSPHMRIFVVGLLALAGLAAGQTPKPSLLVLKL